MHPLQSQAQRLIPALLLATLLNGSWSSTGWAEEVQAMVNRANQFANAGQYGQAVPLYEQIVKQAPQEHVLKKNLMVLYVNYGHALVEQKDYPNALIQFDKTLRLNPENREAKTGKAATYYYQAMELRDSTPEDYAGRRALLEKAIALNAEEGAFAKALGGVYLDEAIQLAGQEQFTAAADLLERARTYDPQSVAIRQSLANVYLGMARDDIEHRQTLTDQALAIDNSPSIKTKVDHLLAAPKDPPVKAGGTGGFADAPDEARADMPKELSQLSVAEMLSTVEKQLSIEPPKDATLMARLEATEKQVLGKAQKGPLAVRAKEVYTALMGSYAAGSYEQSNMNLMQAPVETSANSYLEEVFKMTDGKVVRWGKFPLRVYIEDPKVDAAKGNTSPEGKAHLDINARELYRPEYKQAALEGINAWKAKTSGFINFIEVKNPAAADIVVKWQDVYVDRFADPDTAPDIYKNYSPPKKSALLKVVQVASMLTPGYYSLAPQAVGAMMQYKELKKADVLREESEIKLGLAPTRELPPDAAKMLVQNMAAKEFGHALGLKANSPQPGDLLYPELKSDVAQLPTPRDLETLRQLYNRPPNIILNVR